MSVSRRPVLSTIAAAAAGALLLRNALTPSAQQELFVTPSLRGDVRATRVRSRSYAEEAPAYYFNYNKDAYPSLEFGNDIGYFPDGTAYNLAGNEVNHPENIAPDPHQNGSPLPQANFVNSVGYFPDGTAYNLAGNEVNHPENIAPDPHVSGSPLPKSPYIADIGYFADGTDITKAGNALNHA